MEEEVEHAIGMLDDDDASSSCDENIDPHALNEELSIVCEKLIEKYNIFEKEDLCFE